MDRKQMITNVFLVLLSPILLLFIGCNDMPLDMVNNQEIEADISSLDADVVTANTQFGFNLFNEIRKTEPAQNTFISPLSISIALAMTLNGASGETEQLMQETLQLQGIAPESINTSYARLRRILLTADPKVTLTIANALWARQGVPFKQDFLQRNTQFFGAKISTLDFNDPNASNTINQWVNTNTNGKIPEIVGEAIDPATVLFLTNAIYFKGAWQEEFDPTQTQNGTFYLANGTEKQVPMMRQQHQYPYYRGANFQAISLAYGEGQMHLYIFLPDPESDLNTFLDHLNAENWEDWMSHFQEKDISLVMPKFKLEYKKTVKDPLKALGMAVAFDPALADFNRMAPVEIPWVNLYIAEVLHKSFIEVNEEGTEAAGATSIEIGVTSIAPPPTPFIVDRSFFFAIRDNETQAVLFMGTVLDP